MLSIFPLFSATFYHYTSSRSKVIYIYVVIKLPVMWTISATLLYISLISPDKY